MYEIPQNYQEIRKRWDSFCQSVHPDAICQKIRVESAWRNPLKLSGNQKMLESTWCYAERLSLQIYIYMCWSLLCMTHHMLKGCCDLQVYNEKSNPFLKFACKSRHIIMSLWRKGLIRKCGDWSGNARVCMEKSLKIVRKSENAVEERTDATMGDS